MADEELLREFFNETARNMERVDEFLKRLETNPRNAEAAGEVLRAFHTLAGTCGFFGFEVLGRLGRGGEKLLTAWRDGRLSSTGEAYAAVREAREAVRRRVDALRRGSAADGGEEPAVAKLERAMPGAD